MTFIAHSSAFGIRNPSRRIHHSSFIIHRSSFIPALAIVCLSFSGSAAQALELSSGAEQVCFVFTGTRHSELEPCGCHDLQSGGVDHEAYIFDGLRKTYPNFVAMEVGAWTDPFMNPNERLKTDFLVKALGEMRFTVFNITPYDLAFGTTYPLQLAQDGGCLISANVHVSPRNSPTTTTAPSRPYDPYTIVEVPRRDGRRPIRVGVIGVTDSRALDFRGLAQLKSTTQIPDCVVFSATETLKAYLPQIRKQADYVIALAMMDLKSAQAMPAIEGMDLLVTTKDDQSQAAMAAVHTSTWVHTGFYGRSFHKVILTFDEENRPIRISGSREDVPLASPSVAAMTNLLDQYREETKKLTRKMEVAIEKSRYIGRVSCINCHSSQYMQWTRTAHNFAYLTLA
ncbi:hypothetical protein FJY63_14890, partial [Candidatus Sumerlaeota bacterium]|nr:hypothetical protein [Candidatus Sumerlaeota bacterium]